MRRLGTRPGASVTERARARTGERWDSGPYARALHRGHGPLHLRRADGGLLPLDVERWCAPADAVDLDVLDRAEGPVLDIGCGPGRLVAALAARGRPVLGIDASAAAVARTVQRGGAALRRSVFHALPGEGRWATALLLDGNIGIGGAPAALLSRTSGLLRPGGLLLVETAATDVDECLRVRVEDGFGGGAEGPFFPWARIGPAPLVHHAQRQGWRVVDRWQAEGRHFTGLRTSD